MARKSVSEVMSQRSLGVLALVALLCHNVLGRGLQQAGCTSLRAAVLDRGQDTIVEAMDIVQNLPSVAPVIAAGNQETQLQDEFTIFVPDNEAWVELNADLQILQDATVSQILGGHILLGTVTFSDLVAGVTAAADGVYKIETITQEILEFTTNGEDLYITPQGTPESMQKAVLVFSDIPTCAGIVHTVSQVLVPVDVTVEKLGERDDKDEGTGKQRFPTAQDIVPAIGATGEPWFEQFTIFIPTDAAFQGALDGAILSLERVAMDVLLTLDCRLLSLTEHQASSPLVYSHMDQCMQLLANHVLVDQHDVTAVRNVAEDYAAGERLTNTIESLGGDPIIVGFNDTTLMLQALGSERPFANVIKGNIQACGGIIHIIDDVLIPANFPPEFAPGDFVSTP